MDQEVRHRVESNVALVEHIVTRMSARFPAHIERDDLVQAGMLALVETAGRYDADRGVAFSTFAGRRIEGAILDVIRHGDWLPRSLRAKSRELNNVEAALLTKTGSTPDHRAVAESADMSVKELSDLRSKVRRGVVMALDRPIGVGDGTSTLGDTIADFDAEEPLAALENRELKAYIRSAIHLLPPRHRAVLVGYFLEERPMDELGALLGVTQSRISRSKTMRFAASVRASMGSMTKLRWSPQGVVETRVVWNTRRQSPTTRPRRAVCSRWLRPYFECCIGLSFLTLRRDCDVVSLIREPVRPITL